MRTGDTDGRGQKRLLVLGVSCFVLGLASIALTIAEPVWYGWLNALAFLGTATACWLEYRKRRTP